MTQNHRIARFPVSSMLLMYSLEGETVDSIIPSDSSATESAVFPFIHSLIKIKQLDKVLFVVSTLNYGCFRRTISIDQILKLINVVNTLQNTKCEREIRSV
jgi:hypothetical protein